MDSDYTIWPEDQAPKTVDQEQLWGETMTNTPEVPDDLKAEYAVATSQRNNWPPEYVKRLIERIAALTAELAASKEEAEKWMRLSNQGGTLFPLGKCTYDPNDVHDIHGGAHKIDEMYICDAHYMYKLELDLIACQEAIAQNSWPGRFACWKALGFPDGHEGNLVAAITARLEQNTTLHSLIEDFWTAQSGSHACGCDKHPECVHTLNAYELRSKARWLDSRAKAAPTKIAG
jgi:hypothetical protein